MGQTLFNIYSYEVCIRVKDWKLLYHLLLPNKYNHNLINITIYCHIKHKILNICCIGDIFHSRQCLLRQLPLYTAHVSFVSNHTHCVTPPETNLPSRLQKFFTHDLSIWCVDLTQRTTHSFINTYFGTPYILWDTIHTIVVNQLILQLVPLR